MLVGVGQATNRPDPAVVPTDRPQPLDLMARAVVAAAEDCDGVAPGSAAKVGRALLERAQSLRVIASFGWHPINPGVLLAERLGIAPQELMLTSTGGNTPQQLVHHGAVAIANGELDVIVVCGAEAMYTRSLAQRSVEHGALTWESQSAETTPLPVSFGPPDRNPSTELEAARGMVLPIHAYPLIENAIRADRGWSLDEHRARLGALWATASTVASTNPYAWITEPKSAEEITTPSPQNRMVSFPYTKLLVANLPVDQGAAYILCSVEAAEAAGVDKDRWIFPLSGADANDHWFMSHREHLHRSPAIRLAGKAAFEGAEVIADELAAVDLYSCFPAVVEMAGHELGIAIDQPERPVTVTGGLTFFGGPGNNYVTHSIAQMAHRLRELPGACGLVSGLGWFATKHSIGIYGSRPPRHEGRDGFRWRDVQAEVDALPQSRVSSSYEGPCQVETYTITYDRFENPERAIIVAQAPDGVRVWGNITDADTLVGLSEVELCGREATIGADGIVDLG